MATLFGNNTYTTSYYPVSPSGTRTDSVYNQEDSAVDTGAVSLALRSVGGDTTIRVRVLNEDNSTLYLDQNVTVFAASTFSWYTIPLSVRRITEIYNGDGSHDRPGGEGTPSGAYMRVRIDNVGGNDLYWSRNVTTESTYFTGAAVYNPSATNFNPFGSNVQRLNSTFSWQYVNPGGQNNGNYRIYVKNNSGVQIGDTGMKSANTIPGNIETKTYNNSEFSNQFTELAYGQSYSWQLYLNYTYTANGHNSLREYTSEEKTFYVPSHVPTVTITAPLSGGLDLTPQMQASFTDDLSHNRQETQWQVRNSIGGTILGFTVPGVNTLTPTYDPTNASVWDASSQALEYGTTYVAYMRALCGDGQWSGWATRTFSIATYAPEAQNIQPNTKTDDLTPVITATYYSETGATKQSHRIQILDNSKTSVLGDTNTIVDSNTSISLEYTSSWATYTPLENGSYYIIRVYVTDNGDITGWYEQQFYTNFPPTAPTNLSPGGGQEVYTTTPTLSATFNDPDVGDTPSVMEVEMRLASDSSLVFQRTEGDANTSFATFIADGLQYDETYNWRCRFRDQANVQGAWSSWTSFTLREGVTITMTNPTEGAVLSSPIQTFSWTYSHPSGSPQQSGRLRIYLSGGALPIYDSGVVNGSYLSQAIPTNLLQNNTYYRLTVEATDSLGQTGTSGQINFSTDWVGPSQPTNIAATPEENEGRVRVSWNAVDETYFVAYRVYRRESGSLNAWVMFDEISDMQTTTTYHYFGASGASYDYTVTVVENSVGANLESSLTTYDTASISFPMYTWLNDYVEPGAFRVKLERNPSRSRTLSRVTNLHQPLGRSAPVPHAGLAYEEEVSVSFGLRMPYDSVLETLEEMIERHTWVMYRDGRGTRKWVNLFGYSIQEELPNRAVLTLQLRVVAATEK